MTFYVGQKVVCVDDYGVASWPHKGVIVEGCIYTIREIGLGVGDVLGVRLHEVELTGDYPSQLGINSSKPVFDNFYRASRFRPIVDRKSSISFTIGADPESERYDNRKTKERVR